MTFDAASSIDLLLLLFIAAALQLSWTFLFNITVYNKGQP